MSDPSYSGGTGAIRRKLRAVTRNLAAPGNENRTEADLE
jgi:hypothetical protein